jgi:hypothetical protein
MRTVVFVSQQSYFNYPRQSNGNFWGLGDMLKGIATAYMACRTVGIKFYVDMSNHPLSEFLQVPDHPYQDLVKTGHTKVPSIHFHTLQSIEDFLRYCTHEEKPLLFCCHGPILPSFTEECREFMQQLLTPTPAFHEFFQRMKPSIPYTIIHVRAGDSHLLQESNDQIEEIFQLFLQHIEPTDLLLSDSSSFRAYIRDHYPSCRVYDVKICHTGVSTDSEAIQNTLFEFFLASQATSIKTHSCYEWVSGFMDNVHKIYNVPLRLI